jgi:hypothetical protein
MDNKVLNERLNELIRQIRLNSKDAHFAEKLTGDLLSVHRQKLSEKSYVFNLGAEQYKIEKGSFYIAKHDKGVLFHIYNSFDMVVPVSSNSLYRTLATILEEHNNEYDNMSDEDKLDHDTFIEVVGIIMAMPLNILNDTEFAIDIATQVMKRTNELYEKAISTNLQPEDAERDAEFRDITLNAEALKEHIVDGMESLVKQVNG